MSITTGKKIDAVDQLMDRLRGMKFTITPEEHQLLGITPEDVQSLTKPERLLTPPEIQESVEDIVIKAYQETPAFRALVTEDEKRDPKKFSRSAKLVGKFLRHLRGVLPPDTGSWIHPEPFTQAQAMVSQALQGALPVRAPVEQRQFPPAEPLSDADLRLFGLTRAQLVPGMQHESVVGPIAFFLGRLKRDGRTVKNEATSKMPDELRHQYLFRLLREIRDIKIADHTTLRPIEQRWLGANLEQLDSIVRALVQRREKTEPYQKGKTWDAVISDTKGVLKETTELLKSLRDPALRESLVQVGDIIDSALPPADLIADRLTAIQGAANELGLSKPQLAMLMEIEPATMVHTPGNTKEQVDYIQKELSDANKQIAEQGESPERIERRDNIQRRLDTIQEISSKDTSKLFEALRAYTETLSAYKDIVEKKLSKEAIGNIPGIDSIMTRIGELSNRFNNLMTQGLFQDAWSGVKGIVEPKRSPTPTESEITKTAGAAEAYPKKLESFRAGGLRKKFEALLSFADDAESGLEFLQNKLLSILRAGPGQVTRWDVDQQKHEVVTPGNIYNPTQTDFRDNPLGGVGPNYTEINKKLSQIRGVVKKLDLASKKDEAIKILEYLAGLPMRMVSAEKKKKMASVYDYLRRVAATLLEKEDRPATPGPGSGFAPGTSPKGQKSVPAGKAEWLVYRERLTATGKKAVESFFKDGHLVSEFIKQMEMAGLNDMLLKGGEVKAVDIDPILEKVIHEASGTEGSLDNILSTKVAQEAHVYDDFRKKSKEIESARARVAELDGKIQAVDDKYLPRLQQFAVFLTDPIGHTKRQIEERRGPDRSPGVAPGTPREDSTVKPVDVSRENYQSVLQGMLGKYHRGVSTKTAAEALSIPTDEFRKVRGVTLQLKDMKKAIDAEKNPKKRAQLVREYLELTLNTLRSTQDYLNGYRATLESDRATLDNLKAYLGSEEGKRISDREDAVAQLNTLQDNFDHEASIFSYMTDSVRRAEEKAPKATEYLKKVTDSLSKNEVEQLYSVATAPEMEPSKGEAREIKERAKEHEEGLSFIVDRDTYKKNMNRIMTRHIDRGPAPAYKGEGKVISLPSERTEAYKKMVADAEREKADVEKIHDEFSRLRHEQHMYKTLIDTHDKMKAEANSVGDKLNNLKELQKQIKTKAEGLTEEEQKKAHADILGKIQEYGLKEESLDKAVRLEEQAMEDYKEQLAGFEHEIDGYRKRLKEVEDQLAQSKQTPTMTPQKMKERLMQLRVERAGLAGSRKEMTPAEAQARIKQLQTSRQGVVDRSGMPEAQRKKELEDIDVQISELSKPTGFGTRMQRIEDLDKEIADLSKKLGLPDTSNKEAGTGEPAETQTEFERGEQQLSYKAKPAPFMKELPKPKGWELVENFFDKTKKEISEAERARDLKTESGVFTEEAVKRETDRIDELKRLMPVIDAYKKQVVQVGPEAVPLRDAAVRFEELMFEYTGILNQYKNQRKDASARWQSLQEDVRILQSMFDPETKVFVGLEPGEIKNLKSIFFKKLYKEMDSYWSTKVGKNINVLGERDTTWYDNVFRTFKNLADARSNKKLMSLLGDYKRVTQSEFPQDIPARPNRIDALQKKLSYMYQGLKDQGIDPERSPGYMELKNKMESLVAHKKQINEIFRNMASTVEAAVDGKVKKALADKIPDKKPGGGTDLEKRVDSGIEGTVAALEAEMPQIIEAEQAMDQVEKLMPGVETETPAGTPKTAYDRSHPDFDLKILYGSVMQKTIASMLRL